MMRAEITIKGDTLDAMKIATMDAQMALDAYGWRFVRMTVKPRENTVIVTLEKEGDE